jgi:hypothetical protein
VPGNFGTVDIGDPGNDAEDLWRQIREGPNAGDMAWHNGELKLDPVTGTLQLTGDTGLTVSMKAPLEEIAGHPRTLPLYSVVAEQGNEAQFTIVGFAGVRIVDFCLTGENKYILVEPAMVVDDSAVAGETDGSSYFVGQPVRLVR